MTSPTTKYAEHICETLNGAAAIVIVFDASGNPAGASYGITKNLCRQTAKTLDRICDEVLKTTGQRKEIVP